MLFEKNTLCGHWTVKKSGSELKSWTAWIGRPRDFRNHHVVQRTGGRVCFSDHPAVLLTDRRSAPVHRKPATRRRSAHFGTWTRPAPSSCCTPTRTSWLRSQAADSRRSGMNTPHCHQLTACTRANSRRSHCRTDSHLKSTETHTRYVNNIHLYLQGRTDSSNRAWLIRQTGPMSSGVTKRPWK